MAAAFDGDDLGVVQEAVEDGSGGGQVSEEFSPSFYRAVGRHEGGAQAVAPDDDFQQEFGSLFGQGFHAHVVYDEEFWLEVAVEGLLLFVGVGAGGVEVADEFEDAAVVGFVSMPDGFPTEGLGDVAFADTETQ